jgi:3-methyladenine DNA glycosylase AlkD
VLEATRGAGRVLGSNDVSLSDCELVERIRTGLREAADPGRAPKMQAYMKSAMPYLGVTVPEMRRITRAAVRERPLGTVATLEATAGTLWRQATHREERYAATAITAVRLARGQLALLPLYREMIVTGAWWDHVDEVANRIGDLLASHTAAMEPVVRSWSEEPDRWLRRVSIIAQLGAKAGTDVDLLTDVVDANATERDFFICKGIGWALREYAKTDPGWVLAFVTARADRLSPLSRREALKHIGKGTSL